MKPIFMFAVLEIEFGRTVVKCMHADAKSANDCRKKRAGIRYTIGWIQHVGEEPDPDGTHRKVPFVPAPGFSLPDEYGILEDDETVELKARVALETTQQKPRVKRTK